MQDPAKAAEALLLEKDAFLTSHKHLMDKARILHSAGKKHVFHASFFLFLLILSCVVLFLPIVWFIAQLTELVRQIQILFSVAYDAMVILSFYI